MGLTIIEAETLSVEEALNREVIRKLRLATEAETKEDREIICEELFCDITGTLDANSQERLARCATASARRLPSLSAAARGGGAASCSSGDLAVGAAEQPLAFYEVLARFYERSRDAGEAVAHLCQRLWGQGYAAPIFTLLLHRWLLLGRPPGSSGGGAAGPVRGGAPGAGAGSSALGSDSAAGLGAGGSRAGGGASGAAGAPQPAADRTPEQERRWGRGSQERERPPELASAGESAAATASGAVATDAGGGGPPSEPPGSGGALGSSGALTRLRQLLSPAHSAPSGGDGGAAGGAAEGAPDASALSAREQQQEGVAAAAGAGGAGAQPGASGGGAAAAGQMVPLTSRLPLPPLPLPQRVKEASVLCMGARQLFMGDVHAGTERFAALYRCLEREVAMGPGLPLLAGLPLSTRTDVLAVIACVLPYYARPADMLALVARFPPPAAAAAARRAQLQAVAAAATAATAAAAAAHAAAPAPAPESSARRSLGSAPPWVRSYPLGDLGDGNGDTGEAGAGTPRPSTTGVPSAPAAAASSTVADRTAGRQWRPPAGSGADFMLGEVADMLRKIRSEAGLLKYLAALQALRGCPHLRGLNHITSLRLQSELYSLSSPGGPHYAPRAVRAAAMRTLDALYPLGRRTRKVVRLLFRLLHPTDWLGEFWLLPLRWWAWLYAKVLVAAFWIIYRLVSWRPRRGTRGGGGGGSSSQQRSAAGGAGAAATSGVLRRGSGVVAEGGGSLTARGGRNY